MYIYKRESNTYQLIDYVDSIDTYTIEERIIKLLRKDKRCKDLNKITYKFTGLYTEYFFDGPYAFIVSTYLLNEDGSIKTQDSNSQIEE